MIYLVRFSNNEHLMATAISKTKPDKIILITDQIITKSSKTTVTNVNNQPVANKHSWLCWYWFKIGMRHSCNYVNVYREMTITAL